MTVGRILLAAALMLGLPSVGGAQQVADSDYDPGISQPSVAAEAPRVAIDGGHRNFHTLAGRFAPFGRLLSADGFQVTAREGVFDRDALVNIDVLVIANVRSADGASAFATGEVDAIRSWVDAGGSLFLIADHAPFGDAAAPLAAVFGVEMGTGYAVAKQDGAITSQIEYRGRLVGAHAITAGRNPQERVRHVQSFTGQSLSIPAGATALLRLPSDTLEVAGNDEVKLLRQHQPVAANKVGDRAQAVALTLGKGRVVIAGEAAMFTAQRMKSGKHVGLALFDNQQFTLNILHWLSRVID